MQGLQRKPPTICEAEQNKVHLAIG